MFKVKTSDFFRAMIELFAIYRKYLADSAAWQTEMLPVTLPLGNRPVHPESRRRAA